MSSSQIESTTWKGRSDKAHGFVPRSQNAEDESRLRIASYARALASKHRRTREAGTTALATAGKKGLGERHPPATWAPSRILAI